MHLRRFVLIALLARLQTDFLEFGQAHQVLTQE